MLLFTYFYPFGDVLFLIMAVVLIIFSPRSLSMTANLAAFVPLTLSLPIPN
jgi:hypothetical protein